MMVSIWSKQQDMFETSWEAWPEWTELMSYTKYHLEFFQAYQRAGSELCLLQAVPFPYYISLSWLSLTPVQIGNRAPHLRCCTGTSSVHGRMGSLAWVKETTMSFPERSELSMAVTCFTVQLGGTSLRRPPMDNRACGHIMHSNDCFSEKAGLTFNWCKYGFQIPSRSSCRYFLVKYPR